jgi:8-oxo-dGTP pyrophosphatase MutT (NUDIX family)
LKPSFSEIVAGLESALARPLPAGAAHDLVAPRPRRQWPDGFNLSRIRHAAGLLLVVPVRGRAHVVLTLRADSLGRHGGQVSLPGGVVEEGEAYEEAALREAHEEIALQTTEVRVIGRLTAIDIPVSGFRLHPVVGVAARRPALTPSDGEVARILEVAVDDLMAPGCVADVERSRDSRVVVTPSFCVEDHEIWGATAMVLAEFLVLLGWNRQLS